MSGITLAQMYHEHYIPQLQHSEVVGKSLVMFENSGTFTPALSVMRMGDIFRPSFNYHLPTCYVND